MVLPGPLVAVLTDALPSLAVEGLIHVTQGLHGGAGRGYLTHSPDLRGKG